MSDTVVVACKLPHGLLLQLQREIEVAEPSPSDPGRKVKRHERFGETHAIAGCARPVGADGDFAPVAGGYGLTYDIPRDFWETWLRQNAELPAVVNGFIFAHGKAAETRAQAKAGEAGLSGLEPVNPNKLPDEFRAVKPNKD